MAKMFSLLSLSFAIAAVCFSQTNNKNSTPPFSIMISGPAQVQAGSDVFIKLKLSNTSHHVIDCTKVPTNGSDRAYQYDVRSSDGKPAAKLPVSTRHPEIRATFSASPCVLKPGESTGPDDNLISKLYDMSCPGQYSIRLSRFIDGSHKERGVITSNSITITVVP